MIKIFNHHGDDYQVFKMFDFSFSKRKSRLPLFEQKCSKTEKKKLLRITKKLFSLHVWNLFVNIIFNMSSSNSFN